jgi:hypothetical protein
MFRSSKLGLAAAAVIGFAVVSPVLADENVDRAQKTLTQIQQLCDGIAARNASGGGTQSVAVSEAKPVMRRNATTGGPSVKAKAGTGAKKGGAKKKKP